MAAPFDDIGGTPTGQLIPLNFSVDAIKATAALSGLLGPDPLLRDTSDFRDFSEGFSYHFTGNAVDFGDDQENGSPQQRAFAIWVATYFGPQSLEIIHLNPDNTYVAWKNGQPVDYSFYGDATMQGHRNHVHWAITLEGLKAANYQEDIMAHLPTINVGLPGKIPGTVVGGDPRGLNMQDPNIRTAQALLAARGVPLYAGAANSSHAVFAEALHWFHVETGLPDEGIFGPLTWQRVVLPLNGK